jgi:hypothetical protein
MTIPHMTCGEFAERLADYLESDVSEPMRAAIEAHAASCAECGAILADLREIRTEAAALPLLTPSRDLWAGIAARIETPVVEITSSGRLDSGSRRPSRRVQQVWMGLAAAGLVAVTATITHQLTERSIGPASPTVAAVTTPAKSIDTPVVSTTPNKIDSAPGTGTAPATGATLVKETPTNEKAYDAEISRLRAIVAERRSTLDTATTAIIDRNLKIIDDAIAQCRMALRKDPASRFLMQSLDDALTTKIQLLRRAAALPSRA